MTETASQMTDFLPVILPLVWAAILAFAVFLYVLLGGYDRSQHRGRACQEPVEVLFTDAARELRIGNLPIEQVSSDCPHGRSVLVGRLSFSRRHVACIGNPLRRHGDVAAEPLARDLDALQNESGHRSQEPRDGGKDGFHADLHALEMSAMKVVNL